MLVILHNIFALKKKMCFICFALVYFISFRYVVCLLSLACYRYKHMFSAYIMYLNNLFTVPTDDFGVDPAVLESFLQKHKTNAVQNSGEKREFSSLIYMIPTYHNPKGHCLSAGE